MRVMRLLVTAVLKIGENDKYNFFYSASENM